MPVCDQHASPGPGEVVLAKVKSKDGLIRLLVQLENAEGVALAHMELTEKEARKLVLDIEGSIRSIWG